MKKKRMIMMTAYDGEGNLLQGVWTYEWDEAAGLGKLVLTVPEPAAVSAVLGALALALAARRARKK